MSDLPKRAVGFHGVVHAGGCVSLAFLSTCVALVSATATEAQDNFARNGFYLGVAGSVGIYTELENEVALAWAESGAVMRPSTALRALNCDPLEEPIGQVDVELTMTMTAEGIQFEYKDTAKGTVNRSSSTWKDMYGDD